MRWYVGTKTDCDGTDIKQRTTDERRWRCVRGGRRRLAAQAAPLRVVALHRGVVTVPRRPRGAGATDRLILGTTSRVPGLDGGLCSGLSLAHAALPISRHRASAPGTLDSKI